MSKYEFDLWDRVEVDGKEGEIVSMVPGDGKTPWYFVRFDDGSEDRFTADQIKRVR